MRRCIVTDCSAGLVIPAIVPTNINTPGNLGYIFGNGTAALIKSAPVIGISMFIIYSAYINVYGAYIVTPSKITVQLSAGTEGTLSSGNIIMIRSL
jgi:hypothetical protein